MKKKIYIGLGLVIIFITIPFIFIPKKVIIRSINFSTMPIDGMGRTIIDSQLLKKFQLNENNIFTIENLPFKLQKINTLGTQFTFNSVFKSLQLAGSFDIINKNKDTSLLVLTYEFNKSLNPITQYIQYFQAHQIKKKQIIILEDFKKILNDVHFIYGIQIKRDTVKNLLYLTTSKLFNANPTIPEIYTMIYNLKNYIDKQNTKILSHPMLNITSIYNTNQYQVTVAFATEKELKNNQNFLFKRMIRGDILIAQIQGGFDKIKTAQAQINQYIQDNRLTTPAIPFEVLITDRLIEKDSTKWVTELHYPVIIKIY